MWVSLVGEDETAVEVGVEVPETEAEDDDPADIVWSA